MVAIVLHVKVNRDLESLFQNLSPAVVCTQR